MSEELKNCPLCGLSTPFCCPATRPLLKTGEILKPKMGEHMIIINHVDNAKGFASYSIFVKGVLIGGNFRDIQSILIAHDLSSLKVPESAGCVHRWRPVHSSMDKTYYTRHECMKCGETSK